MKQTLSLTAALAATLLSSTSTQAIENKSLVISLDGLRADSLWNANTPFIDSLINGTFDASYNGAMSWTAQNVDDADTVSGPNHAAIMTGVTATKHGVTNNGNVGSGDYATYPHYMQRLETANSSLNTAYLYNWSEDGKIPSGANLIKQDSDAKIIANAEKILNGRFKNQDWTKGTNVDAMFLFLDDPDHAGHSSGFTPLSANYISEIESIDTQIGTLLNAIKDRSTFSNEDWQIIITSDHGGLPSGHGGGHAVQSTIPYIVSSKTVQQGLLTGTARSYDAASTALDHMGLTVPTSLDGIVQGSSVYAASAPDLTSDLVTHLTFDNTLNDASGSANHATIGANSDHDPTLYSSGGKLGGYVEINNLGGGTNNSSYLSLGTGNNIQFGDNDSFTTAMWYRVQGDQTGDSVILSNKDWNSGANQGWQVIANSENGNGDDFGGNFASDSSDRTDVMSIDYTFNQWWFVATTYDADGNVIIYAGKDDGVLHWMSKDASSIGDLSSLLDLNIGQDGTGNYAHNLDADIDELAIWRRSLTLEEISLLYNDGAGIDLNAPFSAAVPEPTTLALLSLAGLTAIRRR